MSVKTTQDKMSDQLFHVYLRDGRTFAVTAATFGRQVTPDDVIKFMMSDGAERDDVFLRAPETAAIAPESSPVMPAPLAALQGDVELLKSRVDELKNSLGEVIKNAVAAAFSERGM